MATPLLDPPGRRIETVPGPEPTPIDPMPSPIGPDPEFPGHTPDKPPEPSSDPQRV